MDGRLSVNRMALLVVLFGLIFGMQGRAARADEEALPARHLRVAVVQFDSRPGRVQENLDSMERLTKQAVAGGARLVMFHELATVDYMDDMRLYAEPIPEGPSCRRMGALAEQSGCYISFGMPERNNDQLHIAQVFFSPEKYLYHYRKTWLCQMAGDDGYRDEWARYNPGTGPTLFYVEGMRATCFICADGESTRCIEQARAVKPELVFFPINRAARKLHGYPDLASRIRATTFISNRVGESHTRNCSGGSLILDAEGNVIRQANRDFAEEILFHDIVIPR